MLRQRFRCCQHSMRKELINRTRNGDARSLCKCNGGGGAAVWRCKGGAAVWWCSVLLFGLLLCSILPHGVCEYTPPANCTSVSFRIEGTKMHNISCQNLNLTHVPTDNKEGSDVYKLDLSGNLITTLGVNDFLYFTNLAELNLANNKFTSLPVESFYVLTNLKSLSLAGNNFSATDALPYDLFAYSNIIEYLDLSSNPMSSLPKLSSDYLRVLNISNCSLTALDKKLFNNLNQLEIVDISNNSITTLEHDLFKKLDSILSINLSWNQISEINIRGNKNAKSIDLSHNEIDTVDNQFLDDGDTLTNLDLSHNKIPSLGKDVFKDCADLETLNLSYNKLETLPDNIFKEINQLLALNLSHNEITSLPNQIFDDIPLVENLDLSDNNLTTIQSEWFAPLQSLTNGKEREIDLSNNQFVCACPEKELLFELFFADEITNVDETKCTDNSDNKEHIYLDYDSDVCEGYLGSQCVASTDCMVRNSVCDTTVTPQICVCDSLFYDNNGVDEAKGLCKDKQRVDYPCDMSTACLDDNADCSGTPSKCACKTNYYDNQPVYMGGTCRLQVELGETCSPSIPAMCRVSNSYCNSSQKCDCKTGYYDENTEAVVGGECISKLALHVACIETYQCNTTNAECINGHCNCSTEYYDFGNDGECRGPEGFFSCYGTGADADKKTEVVFSSSVSVASTDCEQTCFRQDERYFAYTSGVCFCGNLKPVTTTSITCCPKVANNCDHRAYVGMASNLASAGISIGSVPLLFVGHPHLFTVRTSLANIDFLQIGFGESEVSTNVSSSSVNLNYTYTNAGLHWLSVSGCVKVDNVCEDASVPIVVQVRPENLKHYLTGSSYGNVEDKQLTHSTFMLGFSFRFKFTKEFNQTNTTKKECSDTWTPHRTTCIKLETTSKDFASASTACPDGGRLLKIDFDSEISEVVGLLSGSASTSFWLGAKKSDGIWSYPGSDNSRAGFNDITGSTNGQCAQINGNTETLISTSCTASAPYVCMKDPSSCPYGGQLMPDGYCLLLVKDSKNWTYANTYCDTEYGGWLANITDASTQTNITALLTSGSETEAWIGLHSLHTGYHNWADLSSWDLNTSYQPSISLTNHGDCFITRSNNTWSKSDCANPKAFVCQYSTEIDHITVPSYVNGLPKIDIPAGESLQTRVPIETAPAGAASGYKIALLPGMLFSRDGYIRYFTFSTENIPAGTTHTVSIQHYKAECTTGTLTQPGCASTMFSTCSTGTHTCPSTDTLTDSQRYCYISNKGKAFNKSCSCNSEAGSADAVQSCSSYGTTPTYKLAGQAIVTDINKTGAYMVSAADISVEPLDIIGVQYPSNFNPIKCTDEPTGPDQSPVYLGDVDHWLTNQESFPTTFTTENKTCHLQAIYSKNKVIHVPDNLAYSSYAGDYRLTGTVNDVESRQLNYTLLEPIEHLSFLNPPISETNTTANSFGTIYTEQNLGYNLTFAAGRGTNAVSKWTYNGATTSVAFNNACTPTVEAALSQACNATLYWSEKPFSTFPLNTTNVGNSTLQIEISFIATTFNIGTASMSLNIRTEVRISGVTFSLVTSGNVSIVPLNNISTFATSVTKGTGLSYVHAVDGVVAPSSSSSLLYNFTTLDIPYIVAVTVGNILGTKTKTTTVVAKQSGNFKNCRVVNNNPSVAAIGIAIGLQVQCEVSINAEVNTTWTFSNGTNINNGSVATVVSSSPYTWPVSVIFSRVQTGVNITAKVKDAFQEVLLNLTVNVYDAVSDVSLTLNASHILTAGTVECIAVVPTGFNFGTVQFTFDFNDGTTATDNTGTVTHQYVTAGNYTMRVTASNGASSHSKTSIVTVYDVVNGLSVTNDSPKLVNQPVTFIASTTHGNFLSYEFVSSTIFNVTQTSATYAHTFLTADDYNVTVKAFNKLSNVSVVVTAYVMNVGDPIRITALTVVGQSGCSETTVPLTLQVYYIHYDAGSFKFDWILGNGRTETTIVNTTTQTYSTASNYTVQVTAKHAATSTEASSTKVVCVQERISSPTIVLSSPVALPSTGSVTKSVSLTVVSGSDLAYVWSTNATVAAGTTSTNPTFSITFSAESYYFITVNVSNAINYIVMSKVVQTIQVIDGVAIGCNNCITKSGELYAYQSVDYLFSVTSTSGSIGVYSWNFNDSSSVVTGTSVTHQYTTVGTYNLTVNATNDVTSLQTTSILVHVQVNITSVALLPEGHDWTANTIFAGTKDLNIANTARFKVIASPTGQSVEYCWIFDVGLPEACSDTDSASHTYTETGIKSVNVTAKNAYNSMNASIIFYAIEDLVSGDMKENGTVLTSSNHVALVNTSYLYEVTSDQIVTNTVTYMYLMKLNGRLENSGNDRTFLYFFPSESNFTLTGVISVSSGSTLQKVFNIEAIKALSHPFITSSISSGNMTVGSNLTLSGGVTEGKYAQFLYFYSMAPSGESIPPASGNNVTIQPGQVGYYVVTLKVYNSVSPAVYVNYTFNVMIGVSNVTINIQTQTSHSNAIEVGNSLTFNASVRTGTNLTYSWRVEKAGSVINTGVDPTFVIPFTVQALYNITVQVTNNASSGTAYKEIYALNRVPQLVIVPSGATYKASINSYVTKTNNITTFGSNLTSLEFLSTIWNVNGTTAASTETYTKNFTSPGVSTVALNVSNLIGVRNDSIVLVVQDELQGLSVSMCNTTIAIHTAITMSVTYSKGTNMTIEYRHENSSSVSTGPLVAITYNRTGTFSSNITAWNYVGNQIIQCFHTAQGRIDNLSVTKSPQNAFENYPVLLVVSGDYIDPATFRYVYNGRTDTKNTPSIYITFSVKGTYAVNITVCNDVSCKNTSVAITVGELECVPPSLSIADGKSERTTRKSRAMELSVDVLSDCDNYTSEQKFLIYQGFCQTPFTTSPPLDVGLRNNTPTLTIPKNSLAAGNYCVIFKHIYLNTPVENNVTINVTVVKSNLKSVLDGGNFRMVPLTAGGSLTLIGNGSRDPDEDSTLLYNWSCTMITGGSNDVVNAVNAVTTATAGLTSLPLSAGDKYNISLTVSAPGRQNDTTSQIIFVVAEDVPIFHVKCVSCEADGHYKHSRGVSFEGQCVQDCTRTFTYEWIITDLQTLSDITVADDQTSTGLTGRNLVLGPSVLEKSKDYSIELKATVNGLTGTSNMTVEHASNPSTGSCTVVPSSNVLLLDVQVNVTCTGVTDDDPLSNVYYEIWISPSTGCGETYLAYFGPKFSSSLYITPCDAGNANLTVYAVNDVASKTFLIRQSISFREPTTDKLDYLIGKMVTQMKMITKKNSPSAILQYDLAILNYLNRLSKNSTGTLSQRMALRDVVFGSISGLNLSSLHSIQQMSSTLELLTEYPNELSTSTLDQVLTLIDTLGDVLEGAVKKGMSKINTNSLFGTVNKAQSALNSSSSVTSNSTILALFEPSENYKLSISTDLVTVTYPNTSARVIAWSEKTMNISFRLVLVYLKAVVAGEEDLSLTFSDGSSVKARNSPTEDATQNIPMNGSSVQLGSGFVHYLATSDYSQPSVFQYALVNKVNPYSYGTSENKTMVLSFALHDPSGDELHIAGLPDDSNVKLYLFATNVVPYEVHAEGLHKSANFNATQNLLYSTKNLDGGKWYRVNRVIDTQDVTTTAWHVQVRGDFTSASNGIITAQLYKAQHNTLLGELNVTKSLMIDSSTDSKLYTFFLNHRNVSTNDVVYLKLKSSHNVTAMVGVYKSKCEYWDLPTSAWSTSGCEAQDDSIPSVICCKCNHSTSFGGSLLVSPDQLDFTDLSEVDFSSNPIAIITCSVILFLYIVLVIAFKRMDIMDVKRISLIPLCGKDGSFKYEVTVVTGRLPRAGTTAHVGIRLIGEYGKSVRQHVSKPGAFQRNCSDTFIVAYDVNLGDLRKIQIWHDNSGTSPSWNLSHVIINDLQTDQKYYFFGNTWLTLEDDNGTIQKDIKVAGAHEMTKFTHRMKTATFNALADKHLWLSLFNRPAQSRFTRAQRITCCVTVLYVFVGVNAMWYGLLKKNNTELGLGDFGWEEIVLALVSNVMVLPISVGLVFLFKKSRSKPDFLANVHKPQTAQTLEIENLCGNSQGGSFESDNTGAVPYDLERESTIDSVPHTALGLHRSRHVAKTHRENTDDSFCQKRPSVAVTNASSRSPLWNEDGIMKWPESVPTYDDGQDSRPSTGSTMASVPAMRQPIKPGGSTPGAARKTKKGDAGQLLAELDKLEQDLKETESQSGRSVGHSRKSSTTLRRPTMHKSNWGSLEDILNSDDESVADTSTRLKKRGSTTSQSTVRKFNPRSDPRIQGNGSDWPKSRESGNSSETGRRPRGITSALRPGYYSEMTMESRDTHIPIHKEKCSLPPWCIYIAYVLCLLLSVFSVIIVILYCFSFGYEESVEWVLALILSLVLSILIIEPLKALLIAVYVVAMFKNVEQDEDDDCIDIKPTFDNSNEKIKDVKFKPISGFALLQAKEEGRKIHRMKVIIRQFIAYIFYLWLIMVIVYVNSRYDSYLMTKHVEHDFIAPTTSGHLNFTNITSVDEFWDWTEHVFAGSLYKENLTEEEHAVLLGAPRIRLIRGLTSKCEVSAAAMDLGVPTLTERTCNGEGTYSEDTKDYSEGWNESNSNYSWRYYTAGQLGSTHKIGHVATYGGGGYPQVLGTTLDETDTILSYLKDKGWIDLQTRAAIFEFALYSSGSDTTSMVALLAEFPLTGGVITSYEIQSQRLLWFAENQVDPLMVLEVILLFVIIYSVVHIALQIREHRKAFFKDVWNWYEMLTTLMALVSVGMYIGCVVEATNTFNRLLEDLTEFTNFERAMYVHVGMRYLHAWLLFLLMYKVVKQLRFIKFMYIYEQTLSTAIGHLLGSGLIYVILLLVYAQVGYLMYGRIVSGFESVGHSITTLVVMIRGSFDFWPMLDHHPVFSHFYVYSYYAFAYGIFMALVIAILTSTYRTVKSQMYFTSTLEMQDYEMIEFMLKRFKLWAGIQKPKPAFRRVRFPGLPSISSRSSSSYSNRSSASLQSSQSLQSLTGPQYSEVQLRCMLTRLQPTWQAVLRRMDKIVALDDEEENLVKKAENEMKDLNWKCRINELERQHKELLSWKNQSGSSKPPVADAKQRQSILKRLSRKDNQDRKAPATVSGVPSRTATSTPPDDGKSGKGTTQGRRPLSDQGARVEPSTSKGRSSSTDKSKLQTFFKSIKPSKSAWNK